MRITVPKRAAIAMAAIALSGATAQAQAQEQEFDFEDGLLEPFFGSGDFGVSEVNELDGDFSAFITTRNEDEEPLSGSGAVGNVCSFLLSPFIFPPTTRSTVRARFEVRYKTDEGTGSFATFEDPFHVQLVTERGAVDILTIKTDGIFFSDSRPRTVVEEERAGGNLFPLPRPPSIPTFLGGDLFGQETRELVVVSSLSLAGSGCDPVQLKFSICDWSDTVVSSAAFIDDVEFDFTSEGQQCPPPPDDMDSLGITEFPTLRE
jgi:hypothetical protein